MLLLFSCDNEPTQPSGNQPPVYTQIDFDPAVSSDGNTLVYVHSNVDFSFTGMYSFNLITGFNKQLISGIAGTPDISPDNSKIVFSSDGLLGLLNAAGDSLNIIQTSGKSKFPKWNSGGNKILYEDPDCNSGCGIRITDAAGSGNTVLISEGRSPEWTDNKNEFLFLKSLPEASGDSLLKYDMQTGSRTLIKILSPPDHKTNQYLNYSSGEIIFCSTSESGLSYVYKLNVSSGNIQRLASNQGWSPFYSSATGKIYYTNRNEGDGRIWIMDRDGSNNRRFEEIY
ncbi:MAG: PD40 domain-containing protein [Bacteroidetes bacterium]|nr:PD40 domain-containing protein [Bacteroidota bacterium]